MIGIAEDDPRAEFVPKIALVQAFNRRLRADRHENGSRDIAVGGVQNSGARARYRAFGEELKGDCAGQRLLYCAWPIGKELLWSHGGRHPIAGRISLNGLRTG